MTRNQIEFQRNVETNRSNLVNETETNRANVAKEGLQKEQNEETKRSNLAREAETQRSNLARETETSRSNRAQEALGYANLAEAKRSHLANELLGSATLAENSRHNVQLENITSTKNMLDSENAKYRADKSYDATIMSAKISGVTNAMVAGSNQKAAALTNLSPLNVGSKVVPGVVRSIVDLIQ